MIFVFDQQGSCLERNASPVAPTRQAFEVNHGPGLTLVELADDPLPQVPCAHLRLVDGQVRAADDWQAPAPPVDQVAVLTQVVARNVAASPHDRRFLAQKEIGKQAIAWIKEHPACTPQEAEDYVMGLIQAELPGQPVLAKLYWEYQGAPQGLAMSYLHEAIGRGYLPASTPLTWDSLVALIVATPAEQIAAWLRAL